MPAFEIKWLISFYFLRVFFRGLLVSLSNLYQRLLKLLKVIAQNKPMPFLTDMVLPADMAEFLGPSDALVLRSHPAFYAHVKDQKLDSQTRKKTSAKVKNKKRRKRFKEDLGVSVDRGMNSPNYTSTRLNQAIWHSKYFYLSGVFLGCWWGFLWGFFFCKMYHYLTNSYTQIYLQVSALMLLSSLFLARLVNK